MAGKAKSATKSRAKDKATAEKPVCFVISPIGEPKSETAVRANQTIHHLIEPAAKANGFEVMRADREKRPGVITNQIIERLVEAPLVIADLTESNPNVFYELAVRHVTRKPLVHVVTAEQRIPFDVQMMRTVMYDLTDPDVLESARQELEGQISAVKGEEELENPISNFVELKRALESGDASQVQLAELKRDVQSLTAEVRSQSRSGSRAARSSLASAAIEPGGLKFSELGALKLDPSEIGASAIFGQAHRSFREGLGEGGGDDEG